MKILIVTNIPAPYRIPVYNKLGKIYGNDFKVIYCAKLEPNRQWDLGEIKFNCLFLKEKYSEYKDTFIHNNFDVIRSIHKFRPDVVITTGFNPTYLYSWAYTIIKGIVHIPFTDGWEGSEKHLSIWHKLIRFLVYRTSSSYIAAGYNSMKLYEAYGVNSNAIFISHLCIDNDVFLAYKNNFRSFDVMFSGRITEGKIPDYFVEVVKKLTRIRTGVSVLVIGDGPLRNKFIDSIKATGAYLFYPGFIPQKDLPSYYSMAKLFLFTTVRDAWGIVVNEALASGTPVITTPYAGIINDLIIDGFNGYIVDLDADLWAKKINEILEDEVMLSTLRFNGLKKILEYDYDGATKGIIAAIEYANNRKLNKC